MKNMIRKLTSAFCASIVLFTVSAPSVMAEDEEKFPSGIKQSEFENEMISLPNIANENDSFDYTESGAVGVFRGDEILYTHYFGSTDRANNKAVDSDSVFEWGSITKTLVWVSVMQLKEQGKIDLGRDVREYLPEGFFQHLSYDEPITMMNLMNHTAGWQESTYPIFATDKNELKPLGEALQDIEPAQAYPVGEVTAYSNYGAAVAGYIVECISGMSFADYVHKNIFEPLQMEHTSIAADRSDNRYVAEKRSEMHSYRNYFANCIDLGIIDKYCPIYPCGAATGTLSDLMTYAQALADKDAPLFQHKETQDEMFSGTLFYGDSDIPMWAHGFVITEYNVRTYGHSGATNSCQTNMAIDLESGTGVVAMVNEPDGNQLLSKPFELVFGNLSPDKYGNADGDKSKLNGYYLPQRSLKEGMGKVNRYLQAVKGSNLGEAESIGNGAYRIVQKAQMDADGSAMLLGKKQYSDGKTALSLPSCDYAEENFYLVKLMLLAMYMLTGIGGIYVLLIRINLKKHGRKVALPGSKMMTAGSAASLVSLIAILAVFVFYNNNNGLTDAQLTTLGIIQIICLAVCAVAVVSAVMNTMRSKDKKRILYIFSGVSNCICICAILFYQMYRFWNI